MITLAALMLVASSNPQPPRGLSMNVIDSPPIGICGGSSDLSLAMSNTIGIIRIVLPNPFTIGNIPRIVKYEETDHFDYKNGLDYDGSKWIGTDNIVPGPSPLSFSISQIQHNPYGSGKRTFVLVRIIIPVGSPYSFYDDGSDRHGIALGKKQEGNNGHYLKRLVCGNLEIQTKNRDNVKQVASFLVDLRLRGKKGTGDAVRIIPFNILLEAEDGTGSRIELPISIDPKVHDTGVN